jgi:hypothetical protein
VEILLEKNEKFSPQRLVTLTERLPEGAPNAGVVQELWGLESISNISRKNYNDPLVCEAREPLLPSPVLELVLGPPVPAPASMDPVFPGTQVSARYIPTFSASIRLCGVSRSMFCLL